MPIIPATHNYKVKETDLTREDSIYMSIASVTEIEEKAFLIEKTDSVNKVFNPNSRLTLQIYMNRDVVTIKR